MLPLGGMLLRGVALSAAARLGLVGGVGTSFYLNWACCSVTLHPIRRHCTPSDQVYRDVTGVSRRNGGSASRSEPGEHVEAVSQRPRWTVGVCGDELPAVVLVVGGGAPDP